MSSGRQGVAAQTTGVSGSYGFTGPAEVVFGVLTDPERAPRWLSGAVRVDSAGTEAVKIRTGERVHDYQVEISTEDLQVDWRGSDQRGVYGFARVEDAPAGGSVVHAEITVPASAGDRSAVKGLLDEAMRGLQAEVSDNFNAG
ncbi:SRPBCC family protein [Actinoplanes teichomyceticus]|uniref:Polyketide cyclase/dehydrase/lipid transport protein n=1 Tax=Actinoplanes teichomyceticus TaxID=1867 RepID=A0A561VIA2_ACTTI|nr:SRPBCC family protein [Actinoplanes teichomyceticus]TWG11336.1 polyketide cyclase/dehydrase/lipid transport protein [Actinoplanes teichomyceticus]GIF16368.1 hypothetical protein Ate01nite_64000 [Actinoplanes teichomyceticus]